MPELPEVETIRRGLIRTVRGKRIKNIAISLPKIVRRHASKKEVINKARGKIVLNVKRRGKSLLFILNSSDVFIFRLGMTGQMLWSHPQFPLNKDKHTHLIIDFEEGERLLFKDIRQFGEVYITTKEHIEKTLKMINRGIKIKSSSNSCNAATLSPKKIFFTNSLKAQKNVLR